MAVYPFYEDLQKVTQTMTKGNFGLWYSKFTPIMNFDSCKASDERGNKDNPVEHYHNKYNQIVKDAAVHGLLDKKHRDQHSFCNALSSGYETVVFKAQLKSPLITGIGESHPHEVSMVFDHNMGIPYIPASGVKGIVRFAHTLGLIDKIPIGKLVVRDKNDKPCLPYFDDEDDWTKVRELFGTQGKRGSTFFLDAYPEKVPDLYMDIMNPHYSDYYSDDNHKKPPADYLNPVPIKFLTVAKETVFIFRALVDKEILALIDTVKAAFKKALTEEGVGAKTAVGYGIFAIENASEKLAPAAPQMQEPSLVDKFIAAIKMLKSTDAGPIGSKIDEALEKLESNEEKRHFARAVQEHMGKGFKKSKAKVKLAALLE